MHDSHAQEVDSNEENQDEEETTNRRLTHIRTLASTLRVDRCTLDPDEHPHGDEHHALGLGEDTAQARVGSPEVLSEHTDVECHGTDGNKCHQRHNFGNRGDRVNKSSGANPSQDKRMGQPQQNRRRKHRPNGVTTRERRNELADG